MFRRPFGHRQLVRPVTILVVLVLLWSCDPGFSYRPQGWQTEVGYDYLWSTSFDGVRITTSGISGLLGDRSISPEFEIHNATDQTLVLESAELTAQAGGYLGNLPDDGALEWRTVEPGSMGRISIGWDFEARPMEVLGEKPRLVLTFRLGAEPHSLEITYRRAE